MADVHKKSTVPVKTNLSCKQNHYEFVTCPLPDYRYGDDAN